MITLFETFENKYKYAAICIKVENEDDSRLFQELGFANGLCWINGGETVYLPFPSNGGALLFELNRGQISFNDRVADLMNFLKNAGINHDTIIYSRKDLRTVENILKKGTAGPSYQPRKITRTLESINEGLYFYNNEDLPKDNNIEYKIGDTVRIKNDEVIRPEHGLTPRQVDFIREQRNKSLKILHKYITGEQWWSAFEYAIGNGGITWIPDTFLEMVITKPSYEPRKITRTLEKIDTDTYEYGSICFQLKNKEEVRKVVDLFYDKYGIYKQYGQPKEEVISDVIYTYDEITGWDEYDDTFMDTLFIIYFRDNMFSIIPKIDMNIYINNEYALNPQILTINDLKKWDDIIPSYTPRKITRTLESVGVEPYTTAVFKTMNTRENFTCQEELFKQGYKWEYNKSGEVRVFDNSDYPIYIFATTLLGKVIEHMREETCKEYGGINGYISRCRREGENIVKKVFNYDDAKHIERIMKDGMAVPSYAPRKITRTLESVDGYMYNRLVFKLNNNDDSEKVQMALFDKGYTWSSGDDIEEFKVFPAYLFISSINRYEKHLTYCDTDSLKNDTIDNYIERRNRIDGNRICPTPFSYKDIPQMDILLKRGEFRPNYTPRKITRTLENKMNEEADYKHMQTIVVRVEDMNDVNLVKSQVHKIEGIRHTYNEGLSYLGVFPNWMFIELKLDPNGKSTYLNYWSSGGEYERNRAAVEDTMITDYTIVDKHIYTPNEIPLLIRSIKKYFDFLVAPNYNPRRITRTLEAYKAEEYKYEGLVIRIDDVSEVRKVIDYFYNKYDIESDQNFDEVVNTFDLLYGEWHNNHMIVMLKDKEFMMVSERMIEKYIKVFTLNPIIYTVDDLKNFNRNLEIGPDYSPRKINRTLESINEGLKLIDNNDIARTQKTPPKFYIGDVVTFNPDSAKIHTEKMLFYKGNEDEYIKNWIRENVGNDLLVDSLAYDVDTNDWLVYVKAQRNSFFIHQDAVMFGAKPTYSPRKITRTLEPFENKYKHQVIVVEVNNAVESTKFQELCFKNEISWASGSLEPMYLGGEYPDYLEISLGRHYGNPCISHGSERPTGNEWEEGKADRTIYTIKDYNKVKAIIERGEAIVIPSYTPRRITRTLESFVNKSEYEILCVRLDTYEDGEKVQKLCFDNEIYWSSRYKDDAMRSFGEILDGEHIDNYMYIKILKGQERLYRSTDYDEDFMKQFKHPGRVFTINNYRDIEALLKYGKFVPSYAPRKIIRESLDMDRYEALSEEIKKNGIVIYVTPSSRMDALRFFDTIKDSSKLEYNFAKKYEIENWYDNPRDNQRLYFGFTLHRSTKRLEIKITTGNSNWPTRYPEWFISTSERELISKLFDISIKPSYAPRKINRDDI